MLAGVLFDEPDLACLAVPDFPDNYIVVGVAALQLVLWQRLRGGDRIVREGFEVFHRDGVAVRFPRAVFPALGRAVAIVAPAYRFEADALPGNSHGPTIGPSFFRLSAAYRLSIVSISGVILIRIASVFGEVVGKLSDFIVFLNIGLEAHTHDTAPRKERIMRGSFHLDLQLAVIDLDAHGAFQKLRHILSCRVIVRKAAANVRLRRAVDDRRNNGLDIGKQDVEVQPVCLTPFVGLTSVGSNSLFCVVGPALFEPSRRINALNPFLALFAQGFAVQLAPIGVAVINHL